MGKSEDRRAAGGGLPFGGDGLVCVRDAGGEGL